MLPAGAGRWCWADLFGLVRKCVFGGVDGEPWQVWSQVWLIVVMSFVLVAVQQVWVSDAHCKGNDLLMEQLVWSCGSTRA